MHERESLIRHLGVPTGPDEIMDEFATSLATSTDFLYGFVNVFLAQQTFVGLHNPPPDSGHMILGRSMSLEHGWCPAVVRRRMALPLHDVYANCRFAGNYVVDAVGIRSYFGSPLIHPETGITLGTVCVIDPDVRTLADSRRLLGLVKSAGAEVLHTLIASANDR
ncbi:GAF domain-containing protein [Streptomyces griseoviridis]|uniref:GAF domain-containing protein n=1 Tax=Streptomyces griseoviridis TaxID=45398 RepID=A0A3Q9L266_STRGD|nr:GAF domain-containing protein [Streptomyces griseoviridis]QCN90540.1 histidine kinase [Streptomyces griseoviridis]